MSRHECYRASLAIRAEAQTILDDPDHRAVDEAYLRRRRFEAIAAGDDIETRRLLGRALFRILKHRGRYEVTDFVAGQS